MKLTQLAIKPQLIKITLDDSALTEKYSGGEPIEFWTWDRQPMNTFLKLANQQEKDMGVVDSVIIKQPVTLDKFLVKEEVSLESLKQEILEIKESQKELLSLFKKFMESVEIQ